MGGHSGKVKGETTSSQLVVCQLKNRHDWLRLVVTPPPFFPPGSIYGFNVGVSRSVQQVAAKRDIPLRLHSIIYKLIDELKEELSAKLPPLVSRNIIGEALYTLPQTRRSHDLPVTGLVSLRLCR